MQKERQIGLRQRQEFQKHQDFANKENISLYYTSSKLEYNVKEAVVEMVEGINNDYNARISSMLRTRFSPRAGIIVS